jgi:hypothetical protein
MREINLLSALLERNILLDFEAGFKHGVNSIISLYLKIMGTS